MARYLFVVLGSLFVGLGVLGILLPGLPTTPFLLLAAACYVRGSKRLHNWLLGHRLFGRFIRDFQQNRALPLRTKILALLLMWTMILISALLLVKTLVVSIVILSVGIIGSVVMIAIPTSKNSDNY